ncbi:hypothetical protein BH11BAC7_BH11BAC7_20470 [soil metagenome]
MEKKILIIEDNLHDIDLILYELEKGGVKSESRIVYDEQTLRNTLKEFVPDLILSDYSLPSFDGERAFWIIEEIIPGTPFIFVSGTIGEEKAVELIKSGVTDYALKDKLYTLVPKIQRTLKEAEEKKEKIITDEKLRRTTHLYAFLGQVNQNIVRVNDEATLFRNSCMLAVDFGKYKMAWIGLFDTEGKTISLIEQYGIANEDLKLFDHTNYNANGPQAQVIRTGNYYVCNDIQNKRELINWKSFALANGINSCLVLPLKRSGKIIGTFNLYSAGINFAASEEINLLEEVARDISFALELFQKEKKQIDTDKKLLEREALFRTLIEKSVDMKMLSSIDGKFIYGSPSVTRTFGYSLEEFLKKSAFTFFHPGDLPDLLKNRAIILEVPGSFFSFRYRLKHKDGHWIWCEGTLTNMLHEPEIQAFVSNFRDITEKKIAEEDLEFDKNNLNALINNTKDLMWSVDKDFKLITSNIPFDKSGKTAFGATIKKGENVLHVSYTPEMRNHFKQLYERAFKGESFTEIEHFDLPFDMWLEFSYYPIRKGDEIIGTACHSRDITMTKVAEQQLRKSEEFSTGILSSLSSNIAVVNFTGTIMAVNESWKRFAKENGATKLLTNGVGVNYYDVCEKAGCEGSPEAGASIRGIKDVMNGKITTFYTEYPCHSPAVKRWYGLRVVKFDSREPMVILAHQDISERRLAQEDLEQSEFRLNEAQAIAHLGNWELNFQTQDTAWSEETCRIYGVAPGKKTHKYAVWESFIHPDDLAEVKAEIKKAGETLSDIILNHRILLKDGSIKHIYSKAKFKLNQQGIPVGLIGIILDVTERKIADGEREKMTSNLIQHTKNLEQFATIVSHNLRAPVANIIGLAEILKKKISEEDRARSEQYLFDATKRLDEMLKDLNKILEVRSEVKEYKETVYFDELVNVIKSSIHNVIEKEKAQIICDFSAIDKITTIKSFMHSVFFNLISNSIKYRTPGIPPIIKIQSEVTREAIIISFKDNGVGIDLKRHNDKIFGLYKRFHAHTEGRGLGLFMVRTQIETMGGKIKVESKPEEGSEFIIEMPLNSN